jgi:hypothetical protein
MPLDHTLTLLIAAFGTSQVVLAALVGWLGKVWLERISRNEKSKIDAFLQAQKSSLDTGAAFVQHVGKARFDMEVRVYGELWNALHEVKEAAGEVQFHREGVEPTARSIGSKTRDFEAAVGKALQAMARHKPFFAPAVNTPSVDLVKLCRDTVKRAVEKHPTAGMPNAETIRDMISIQQLSDAVAEAIRSRLYDDHTLLPKVPPVDTR